MKQKLKAKVFLLDIRAHHKKLIRNMKTKAKI